MDFGSKQNKARLTWLIGPPGAGKSTFVKSHRHLFNRVVEFDQLLGPLVNEHQISKGILSANNLLISVVRKIEMHEANIHLPALLVVAGTVDPNLILPLSPDEAVWMILPPYDCWEAQLLQRPTEKGDLTRQQSGGQKYRNFEFAKKTYFMMESLANENLGLEVLDIPFNSEHLGKTYHETTI